MERNLRARLDEVEGRLERACRRAGRLRSEITLVAVTKTVPAKVAALLPALGQLDLGESRPQELWKKAAALPGNVRWHLVGHLQRNKIDKTLPITHLIHSIDSVRLLQAIETEAAAQDRQVDVLLEVNASHEPQKHGFEPEQLPAMLAELDKLKHVGIRGLMTMAALEADAEECRPTFTALRELRDRFRPQCPPPHALNELSMGMSNDFEVAVEEGATLVRLGTVLFG